MTPKTPELSLLAQYWSVEECARELGIRPRTLARLEQRGLAPPRTVIARRILYRKAGVAEWLRSREQQGTLLPRKHRRTRHAS